MILKRFTIYQKVLLNCLMIILQLYARLNTKKKFMKKTQNINAKLNVSKITNST